MKFLALKNNSINKTIINGVKMRITTVQYSRVYSLGNYENEKIGVDVEVLEGEDPQAALAEARKFVDMSSKVFSNNLEKALFFSLMGIFSEISGSVTS